MPFSPQLRSHLTAHLGPHSANELEAACVQPNVAPMIEDFKALHREFLALSEKLDAALIRIEHLEHPKPAAKEEKAK